MMSPWCTPADGNPADETEEYSGWFVMSLGMEKPFRKDLSHLTWDEVYARQASRAALIPDWLNALRLKSGDRVLEIGAGLCPIQR
jgi:hypothetical protein